MTMNVIYRDSDSRGNLITITREPDKHGPDGFAFYIYANQNCIWKRNTRAEAIKFVEEECL